MDNNDKKELLHLRQTIYDVMMKGKNGHLASCYSCLEIIYTLYIKEIIKCDNDTINNIDRDRFVLSKGHGVVALYAVLEKKGLISKEMLYSYLSGVNSIGGEPSKRDCKYIEASTGSLGHGISEASGMALGLKLNNSTNKVYCLVGDGEMQEGVVWEALAFLVSKKLDNITIIVDNNKIQKTDKIENIVGENNLKEKLIAFGLDVSEVDGHNVEELYKELIKQNTKFKPKIIIANTIKGKGVSLMENDARWHYRLPNVKEIPKFLKCLELGENDG